MSDLDGTMVGDGEEADACTADFQAYWEENAALAGGVLVYNTGRCAKLLAVTLGHARHEALAAWPAPNAAAPPPNAPPPPAPPRPPCRSLGQFQGLLEHMQGVLPVPDVLITAVGTKIWRLDAEGGTRGTATGAAWLEDHQWARTLDEGWDLGGIRAMVQATLDRRGDATCWLVSTPAESTAGGARLRKGLAGAGAAACSAGVQRHAALTGAPAVRSNLSQDNGTEHPHRVCISARADVTPGVVSELEQSAQQRGLQVRAQQPACCACRERCAGCVQLVEPPPAAPPWPPSLTAPPSSPPPLPPLCPPATQVKVIVSGTGDWRYVDVTSFRAGKLAALE